MYKQIGDTVIVETALGKIGLTPYRIPETKDFIIHYQTGQTSFVLSREAALKMIPAIRECLKEMKKHESKHSNI